jgi:FkbM family methyltransferase
MSEAFIVSPKQRCMKPPTAGLVDLDWLKFPYWEIEVDGRKLRYVTTNRLAEKRIETLFSKEPTTIPWLDSMSSGEVLVDVGANVGMYSLYAAQVVGVRVFAFEPEALNYAELNKNIYVNHAHGRVLAFCAALIDQTRVDRLHLGGFAEGLSHHDFGENTWSTDKNFGAIKTSKDARLLQGCLSHTVDSLVTSGAVPFPDHIKIDVDGLEHKVVTGAWRTLTDPRLKTALIEIDHRIPACLELVERMERAGWRYSTDQLRTNRKVVFTEEQIANMRKRKQGGFNYIFFRDDRYAVMFKKFLERYTVPLPRKVEI